MSHLSDALDSFRCYKDKDIEVFLRTKAFQFIDKGWCSIYLILDEQEFDEGHIKIEAYFTLSHKSLITEGISKEKTKKITGGLKNAETLHFVLIGQLGKYIAKSKDAQTDESNITSDEILDYAFEVIRASSSLIPCRFALVECSANEKVQNIYTNCKFSKLQNDDDHYQYYKKI